MKLFGMWASHQRIFLNYEIILNCMPILAKSCNHQYQILSCTKLFQDLKISMLPISYNVTFPFFLPLQRYLIESLIDML